jgi:hypothetical protein
LTDCCADAGAGYDVNDVQRRAARRSDLDGAQCRMFSRVACVGTYEYSCIVLHHISPSSQQRMRPYQARMIDTFGTRRPVPGVTEQRD